MLTVGTGVGGGIVVDGRPYRGASGAAAELGHTIVATGLDDGAPEPDRFPQPGSLESLAAGRARSTGSPRRRPPASPTRRWAACARRATRSPATKPSRRRKPATRSRSGLLRVLGERLGIGIANMINTLDPDVVAIGGGVSIAGELLLEPRGSRRPGLRPARSRERRRRYGFRSTARPAGVLGAAILAKQELTRREERSR